MKLMPALRTKLNGADVVPNILFRISIPAAMARLSGFRAAGRGTY
jgi:hypothetical protein